MKLARFDRGSGSRIGAVQGDTISTVSFGGSMLGLIARWDESKTTPKHLGAGEKHNLSAVRLLALVPRPGKIIAIGLNYADPIAESKMETLASQVWFTKAVTSVNGPFGQIEVAKAGPAADYEVELVAVIGRGGRNIARADAASHVFGYFVGNDGTEHAWQHHGLGAIEAGISAGR